MFSTPDARGLAGATGIGRAGRLSPFATRLRRTESLTTAQAIEFREKRFSQNTNPVDELLPGAKTHDALAFESELFTRRVTNSTCRMTR